MTCIRTRFETVFSPVVKKKTLKIVVTRGLSSIPSAAQRKFREYKETQLIAITRRF